MIPAKLKKVDISVCDPPSIVHVHVFAFLYIPPHHSFLRLLKILLITLIFHLTEVD